MVQVKMKLITDKDHDFYAAIPEPGKMSIIKAAATGARVQYNRDIDDFFHWGLEQCPHWKEYPGTGVMKRDCAQCWKEFREEMTNIGERQLVVITIGLDFYGLPIEDVREIIRFQEVTDGKLLMRGTELPVMDLREKLQGPIALVTPDSRYIWVHRGNKDLALQVDSVSEVLRMTADQIEVPISLERPFISEIAHTGRFDPSTIFIIDLEALFKDE